MGVVLGKNTAVLMYYSRFNRCSVNAIVASLDRKGYTNVYLVEDYTKIMDTVSLLLDKYKLLVIGMSFNTIMLTDDSFLTTLLSLTSILKKKYKEKVVFVAGGPHPSGDPIGTIESLGFDYVVIGEGEESFPDLVHALSTPNRDPYRVPGVFTKYDDRYVYSPRKETVDLDKYDPFPYWRHLFGAIEVTRGCPIGCKYCQVTYMQGDILRHRSIDKILYYLDIMGKLGLKDWRFVTPNALSYGLKHYSRKPRLEVIEELLYKLSICAKKYGARVFYGTFPSEVRPEHLIPETARILKKYVSNKNIIIGAQSGSNKVLKTVGRKHTIEDVYEAVETAIKNGFIPDVDYIIGLPGEGMDELIETLYSIKKIAGMGGRIHLHVFMPLPGTPFSLAPPGHIPRWFLREINKLLGKGKVYGQWRQQEVIARKIHELRIKGIIMPRKNIPIKTAYTDGEGIGGKDKEDYEIN